MMRSIDRELVLAEGKLFELGRTFRPDATDQGVGKRTGLLVDLFRHEVLVAVALGGLDPPRDPDGDGLDRLPGGVDHGDRAWPDFGDLTVVQGVEVPGGVEHCCDVRGDHADRVGPTDD